jgi:cell division protein FtsX
MTSSRLSTEDRNQIGDTTFAFPKQRKEPLIDASHVRNAIARFDQVKDVSDEDREEAFRNIQAAAKKFGVDMTETNWRQLGSKPHSQRA